MKWIINILFIWTSFLSFSQDSTNIQWKEKFLLKINKSVTWSMDNLENHYVSGQFGMIKYDSVGQLKFQQSYKSLGNTTALVPINSMKLVHFSEEQQTLCYFDNTLTSSDDCIDLVDEDIISATLVCRSNQPNKLWVLDNVNSTLILLSLDDSHQRQEIKNLRGILDLDHVTKMIERNNQLLLLDQEKGIFIFDLYGTLVEHIDEEGLIDVDASENAFILLFEDRVQLINRRTLEEQSMSLPISDITQMRYVNDHFFLRNSKGVHKFAVQISK